MQASCVCNLTSPSRQSGMYIRGSMRVCGQSGTCSHVHRHPVSSPVLFQICSSGDFRSPTGNTVTTNQRCFFEMCTNRPVNTGTENSGFLIHPIASCVHADRMILQVGSEFGLPQNNRPNIPTHMSASMTRHCLADSF